MSFNYWGVSFSWQLTRVGCALLASMTLTGCLAGSIKDRLSQPAAPLVMTQTTPLIKELPEPRRKIPVSVFKIKDETGQHKPSDNFAEFSRAVTQAGGSILIDILKNTSNGKWFQVLERVELANVVQERKIISQRRGEYLKGKYMNKHHLPPSKTVTDYDVDVARQRLQEARSNFDRLNTELKERGEKFEQERKKVKDAKVSDEDKKLRIRVLAAKEEFIAAQAEYKKHSQARTPDYDEKRTLIRAKRELEMLQTQRALANLTERSMPSLKVAKYVLAGAIVGFDSNETTGGVGAKFLGIGGDKKHRRDIVTVNLRLVSPFTGEILTSVTTTKTIYAVGLQGGAYKFVSVDKLLEVEAGVTRNELATLSVRQAMELAVYEIILKGVKQGIWQFKDKEHGDQIINEYESLYGKEVASN